MTGFHQELHQRIATAQERIRHAAESDDPFGVDVHVGELETLARLAADHGVAVAGLPEVLTRYGVAGQAGPDGSAALAGTGPIDLRVDLAGLDAGLDADLDADLDAGLAGDRRSGHAG